MPKTMRAVYGETLAELGGLNQEIVVLDADVSSSTQSCLFRNAYPDRFFNVGIAEGNMTAMAAGFASVGKIPFVNTFAVFLSSIGLVSARAFGSYANLPLKLAGAYAGLSDMFDGPSHHSIDDIAILRALPNFTVYVPSDARQTAWAVRDAAARPGPVYIRLSREAVPDVYGDDAVFQPGKGMVLREGRNATVIACGLMVGNALTAANMLAERGVSVRVVDMFCVKPLDEGMVVDCAGKTGAIVTAEEHTVIGGLGGAVAEALCKAGCQVPLRFVGLNDCHAECGPYAALQTKYKLDAKAIADAVLAALKMR